MFKKLATTWALVATYLGIKDVPIVEGKIAFDDDQDAKLKEKFGEEFTANLKNAFNAELAEMSNTEDLAAAKLEVETMLKEAGYSEEEQAEILGADGLAEAETLKMSTQLKQMTQNFLDMKAENKSQMEQIQQLLKDPEPEAVGNVIKQAMNNHFKHSATHLFGSGKSYDAFENRPWNVRLRDGSMKATDFMSDSNIPLLQDDVEHFVRENPTVIDSLFNDFEDLPAEWSRRTGVLDRVASGYIIPGEIVQGRSKGWKPKNNFKFDVEEGKVYRKKIDITFDGFELQEIENTWVGVVKNMDGSHPWKMSFIGFLLSELVKQQKLDDRIAQINGIFAETPAGDGNPGAAVNSQSGLRWLWWYYINVAQKITPFQMGAVTSANVVDYVRDMIERIPTEQRNQTGWEIQMSEAVYRMYAEKAGEKYDLKFHSDLGKEYYPLPHPIDYPNFKFQVLKDMTHTNFIGIVKSSNVQILDYNTTEKGKFNITHDKRETNIFADYRLGIRFITVGTKTEPGDPKEFDKQLMFCNDLPVFDNSMTVPVFDDETGVLKMNFNQVVVDDAWKTDITKIEGFKDGPYMGDLKGQIVTIIGNTKLANAINVKNNTNLVLTADFNLKLGGTLTLFANADGTFKELGRTSAPPAPAPTAKEFTGVAIDASESNQFNFEGTDPVTLNSILNGVHGQKITITKTNTGTVALTISSVPGLIALASTATIDAQNDTITLVNVNGVWTELSRTIAA